MPAFIGSQVWFGYSSHWLDERSTMSSAVGVCASKPISSWLQPTLSASLPNSAPPPGVVGSPTSPPGPSEPGATSSSVLPPAALQPMAIPQTPMAETATGTTERGKNPKIFPRNKRRIYVTRWSFATLARAKRAARDSDPFRCER